MSTPNPIYKFLKQNDLTDKSEEDFVKEYSNPGKAAELHKFFKANSLTDKDSDTFYGEYFKPKSQRVGDKNNVFGNTGKVSTSSPAPTQIEPLDEVRKKNIGGKFKQDTTLPQSKIGFNQETPSSTNLGVPLENQVHREFAAPTIQREFGVADADVTKNKVGESLTKVGGFKSDVQETKLSGTSLSLDEAMEKDNYFAAVYNSAYGGLETAIAGFAWMGAKATPFNPLMSGLADKVRLDVKDVASKGRLNASSKEYEESKMAGWDSTDGFGMKDAKAIPLMLSRFAVDLGLSIPTAGMSYVAQSLDQGFTEFDDAVKDMKTDDPQGLSNSRELFAITYATINGLFDKLSAGFLTKTGIVGDGVKKKILNNVIQGLLKYEGKVTGEVIEAMATKAATQAFNKLKTVGLKTASGAAMEGTTEAIQGALSDGAKLLTNKISDKNIFNLNEVRNNFLKARINDFTGGAVMAAPSGAFIAGMRSTDNYIAERVAESFNAYATELPFQGMADEINAKIQDGSIDSETGHAMFTSLDKYIDANSKLPTTLTSKERKEAMQTMVERDRVNEVIAQKKAEAEGSDEALRPLIQQEVDAFEAKKLSLNDKVVESTTGEKYTYSKDPEKDKWYKQLGEDGAQEEITQKQYDLEMQDVGAEATVAEPATEKPKEETAKPVAETAPAQPEVKVEPVVAKPVVTQPVDPTEGDTIAMPPRIKGGTDRTMIFKDGEWHQKVGNSVTEVSKSMVTEAHDAFMSAQQQKIDEGQATNPVTEPVQPEPAKAETAPVIEEDTKADNPKTAEPEIVAPEPVQEVAKESSILGQDTDLKGKPKGVFMEDKDTFVANTLQANGMFDKSSKADQITKAEKAHKATVQDAIDKGKFAQAVKDGRMTQADVDTITKSAGIEVTAKAEPLVQQEAKDDTAGLDVVKVDKVLPYVQTEDNKYKPEEQLRFGQGAYYEAVRIIAHPEMIELIQMGAQIRKQKPVNQARKAKLEAKYGIQALDSHTKAKDAAKANRSKDEERFVVLGKDTALDRIIQPKTENELTDLNETLKEQGVSYEDIKNYNESQKSGSTQGTGRATGNDTGGSQQLPGESQGVQDPKSAIGQSGNNDAQSKSEKREVVEAYTSKNKDLGIPTFVETTVDKVNEQQAKEIASAYEGLPVDDSSNPEVRSAYEAAAKEIELQYDYLTNDLGITVEFVSEDAYSDSAEMFADVADNKNLRVFNGGEPHPLLGEPTADKNGVTANDKLRAIHDYFGHFVGKNQFGKVGEERAWVDHSKMFSENAQRAITTETRGQNSFVNFSGVNAESLDLFKRGNALIKEGKASEGEKLIQQGKDKMTFAEQKVALLPEQFNDWRGYAKDTASDRLIDGESTTQNTFKTKMSEKAKQYLAKVTPVLKALFPDIEIKVYNTTAEYIAATGRSEMSAGVFDRDNKTIGLNMELISSHNAESTVFHEAIHPIVDAIFKDNADLRVKAIEQINSIKGIGAIRQVFEHMALYRDRGLDVWQIEGITEFLTMVADNQIDVDRLSPSAFTKIKAAFNNIMKAMGLNFRLDTASDVVLLAQKIKEGFTNSNPDAIADILPNFTTKGLTAEERASVRQDTGITIKDIADYEAEENQKANATGVQENVSEGYDGNGNLAKDRSGQGLEGQPSSRATEQSAERQQSVANEQLEQKANRKNQQKNEIKEDAQYLDNLIDDKFDAEAEALKNPEFVKNLSRYAYNNIVLDEISSAEDLAKAIGVSVSPVIEKAFSEAMKMAGRSAILPPPPVQGQPVAPESVKKRLKSLLNRMVDPEKSNLTPEVVQKLADKGLEYEVFTNAESNAIATDIINDLGVEEAFKLADDRSSKLGGPVRTMLFAKVVDAYYEQEQQATDANAKDIASDNYANALDKMDIFLRDSGRAIQAVQEFYRKSPSGILKQVKARLKADSNLTQDEQNKLLVKAKEVIEALKKKIKEMEDDASNGTPAPQNQSKGKGKEKKTNFISKKRGDRVKNISALKKRILSGGARGSMSMSLIPGFSPQQIADIIELGAEYAAMGLTDFVSWSRKMINELDISEDEARAIWNENLPANIDPNQRPLRDYAIEFDKERQAKLLEESVKMVNTMFPETIIERVYPKAKKARRGKHMEIAQALLGGVMDGSIQNVTDIFGNDKGQNHLEDLFFEKYGLPNTNNPVVKAELMALAKKIGESQPGSLYEMQAFIAMNDYIANMKRTNLSDYGIPILYANMLYGIETHQKNMGYNVASVFMKLTTSALRNPEHAKIILNALFRGLDRGQVEARNIMKSGTPKAGSVVPEERDIVERVKRHGLAQAILFYSIPSRSLAAADALLNYGLKEVKMAELMIVQLKADNKKLPVAQRKTSRQISDEVEEMMNQTSMHRGRAQQQAMDETVKFYGLGGPIFEMDPNTGWYDQSKKTEFHTSAASRNWKRRGFEILEQGRDSQIVEEAKIFSDSSLLMGQPRGYAGIISNGLSKLIGSIPILKFFTMPFMNVPLNLANHMIEYSPLGLVTVLIGKEANLVSDKIAQSFGVKRDLTDEQKRNLIIKAALGTITMGAVAALSQMRYDDEEEGDRPILKVTADGSGDYNINAELKDTSEKFEEYTADFMGFKFKYKYVPFAPAFAAVGYWNDQKLKGTDDLSTDKRISMAMWSYMGYVFDQSSMTGLSDMFNVGNRSGTRGNQDKDYLSESVASVGKAFTKMARTFVFPNFIPQIYTDYKGATGMVNKKSMYDGLLEDIKLKKSAGDEFTRGLPYLENQMVTRHDQFGRDVKEKFDMPWIQDTWVNGKTEIDAYSDLLWTKQYGILNAYTKKTLNTIDGKVRFPKEVTYEIDRLRGQYVLEALNDKETLYSTVKNPVDGVPLYEFLQGLSPIQFKDMMNTTNNAATKRAQSEVLMEKMNIDVATASKDPELTEDEIDSAIYIKIAKKQVKVNVSGLAKKLAQGDDLPNEEEED